MAPVKETDNGRLVPHNSINYLEQDGDLCALSVIFSCMIFINQESLSAFCKSLYLGFQNVQQAI